MDTYIIKEGDTIESIAEKFNIPVMDIVKINSLEAPYTLNENDILNIPTAPTNIFNYYKVKPKDTLYSISSLTNTTPNMIAQINGLDIDEYIYPNQVLLLPKNDVSLYITKEGDTLDRVAEEFGTNARNLLHINSNIYLLPEQLVVFKRI